MIKSNSLSKLEEPPSLFLALAVLSLTFNLCFPQYSVSAQVKKQEFEQNSEQKVALNQIKKDIEAIKNTEDFNSEENNNFYAELELETETRAKYKKVVTVTAYSSTVDQCDSSPFITASGTHVRDGIIATNALAFGTKVQFPDVFGDKIFVVEDRMNARYTDRADIWFETREEAKQFGIKRLEMVVL